MSKFNEINIKRDILEQIFPATIENEYLKLKVLLERWNEAIHRFNFNVNVNNSYIRCYSEAYNNSNKESVGILEEQIKDLKLKVSSLNYENIDSKILGIREAVEILFYNKKVFNEASSHKDKAKNEHFSIEQDIQSNYRELQNLFSEMDSQIKFLNDFREADGKLKIDSVHLSNECNTLIINNIVNRRFFRDMNPTYVKVFLMDFTKLFGAALELKKSIYKQIPLVAFENLKEFSSRPNELEKVDMEIFERCDIESYLNCMIFLIEQLDYITFPSENMQMHYINDLSGTFQLQSHIFHLLSEILDGVNIERNISVVNQLQESYKARLEDLYNNAGYVEVADQFVYPIISKVKPIKNDSLNTAESRRK